MRTFGIVLASIRLAVSDAVECPCFSNISDLLFSNGRADGFSVDFHRSRSCEESDTTRKLFFTPIKKENRPQAKFLQPIDGIVWNSLSAVHDTDKGDYQCRNGDEIFSDISEFEARACFDLLDQICEFEFPYVCPCYGLTDLTAMTGSIYKGTELIDSERTCALGGGRYSNYGLYVKRDQGFLGIPCEGCSIPIYTVSEQSCTDGTDAPRLIDDSYGKDLHCRALADEFCSDLQISRSDDLMCSDVEDFLYHGYNDKSCAWAKGSKKKCRKMDEPTGKYVFELCKKTCGRCGCEDDESFIFNGVPGQNCTWVEQNPEDRCKLGDAASHCLTACGSTCCKDSSAFRWWGYHKHSCEYFARKSSKNKTKYCSKASIAQQCPETCGLCNP